MKKLFSIALCILLLFALTGCSRNKYNNQEVLEDIAQPGMNITGQVSDSWYFFKHDKIYAYVTSLDGYGIRKYVFLL